MQQAVIIEGADEVADELLLMVVEVEETYLFLQLVVEGECLANDSLWNVFVGTVAWRYVVGESR